VGPSASRDVTDVYLHDVAQYPVCMSGAKSGIDCGHIVSTRDRKVDGVHLKSMNSVNFNCRKGDSGGPIYHILKDHEAQAVGIVSGFYPHHAGADYGQCIYSQIRHVESRLNVHVKTDR
jgi:hypothetical protein